MNRIAFLLIAVGLLTDAPAEEETGTPAPSEEQLAKYLGGPDVLEAMRSRGRIEAVRVKLKGEALVRAVGDVVETGARFDLSPKQAAAVRALFGNRLTYFAQTNICFFSPGIKFILHPPRKPTLEWLVCLSCGDVAVKRDGKVVGFATYGNGYENMLALASSIFPKDDGIRNFIESREAELKNRENSLTRWLAAMPVPLRSLVKWSGGNPYFEVEPPSEPLADGISDVHERILALLAWYGSVDGPWSHYYSFEDISVVLLLDYPRTEILAALESTTLTEAQMEGAARFFAGWTLSRKEPEDLSKLSPELKRKLLEHSLKSPDHDKRNQAKKAFE